MKKHAVIDQLLLAIGLLIFTVMPLHAGEWKTISGQITGSGPRGLPKGIDAWLTNEKGNPSYYPEYVKIKNYGSHSIYISCSGLGINIANEEIKPKEEKLYPRNVQITKTQRNDLDKPVPATVKYYAE